MDIHIDSVKFRRACRGNTRRVLLNLDLTREQSGLPPELTQEVLNKTREQLENQREPDGSLDVVTCRCGAKVRLPSSSACRCPKCKERLQ